MCRCRMAFRSWTARMKAAKLSASRSALGADWIKVIFRPQLFWSARMECSTIFRLLTLDELRAIVDETIASTTRWRRTPWR